MGILIGTIPIASSFHYLSTMKSIIIFMMKQIVYELPVEFISHDIFLKTKWLASFAQPLSKNNFSSHRSRGYTGKQIDNRNIDRTHGKQTSRHPAGMIDYWRKSHRSPAVKDDVIDKLFFWKGVLRNDWSRNKLVRHGVRLRLDYRVLERMYLHIGSSARFGSCLWIVEVWLVETSQYVGM